MAKKFIVQFADSRGRYLMNCKKYDSPVYGEWTDDKIDEIISYGKKKKAEYVIVKRITSNGIRTEFAIHLVTGNYHSNQYKGYGWIPGNKWVF